MLRRLALRHYSKSVAQNYCVLAQVGASALTCAVCCVPLRWLQVTQQQRSAQSI